MPIGLPARFRFRDLPARAGWVFPISGIVSRVPQAMTPLGIVLLVSSTTGRYGTAGLAIAGWSVGSAIGGPGIGMLADRYGHRIAGLAGTSGYVLALGSLVLVARGESMVGLLTAALLVGLIDPQVGAPARRRWSHLAAHHPDQQGFVSAAFAYEGAADEAAFILGPAIIGTLAALAGPAFALCIAGGFGAAGQTVFALHRSALPGHRLTSRRRGQVLIPWRGLTPLLIAVAAVGTVYGSTQTGIAAALGAQDRSALAGPVYAGVGVGSALAGLLTTMLPRRFGLRLRLIVFPLALAMVAIPLALACGPVVLSLVCVGVGAAIGPMLISSYTLAEQLTPAGRGVTVMTLLGTAGTLGVALAASLGGTVADSWSPAVALLIPSTAGMLAAIAGAAARHTRTKKSTR